MLHNNPNWKDLHSIMITALCELPEETLIGLNNENRLKNYCYAIMRNQVFNSRSNFSKYYNPPIIPLTGKEEEIINEPELSVYDIDTLLNYCIQIAADPNEMIYDKMCADITRLYIEMPNNTRNYRQLHKQTGIHYSSISTYICHLRKRYEKNYVNAY